MANTRLRGPEFLYVLRDPPQPPRNALPPPLQVAQHRIPARFSASDHPLDAFDLRQVPHERRGGNGLCVETTPLQEFADLLDILRFASRPSSGHPWGVEIACSDVARIDW